MQLSASILELKGVGDKSGKLFSKLGIHTLQELLCYFPRDYEEFHPLKTIKELSAGDTAGVECLILSISNVKKVRNLTIMNVIVKDNTGSLQITFYNMPYLQKVLKPGSWHIFYGQVRTHGPALAMEQPRIFSHDEYVKLQGVLQPKYALTKGLTNGAVQRAVKQALNACNDLQEYYPDHILAECGLIPYAKALKEVHFPENREMAIAAHKRLVFDEFFSFLYHLRQNKEYAKGLPNSYVMFETADTVRYLEQLPFRLTKGQARAWQEIRDDMGSSICMNRLIQGDVGSGKTIVAMLSLLMCAANGYQGALMAPTEVLAVQHYEGVIRDINQYGLAFKPVLLVGSMTSKEKKQAYDKIASGEGNLIIGTHALIQEKVDYKNLALVVTDEQHRFGVKQREAFGQKGLSPHVLVMSATPIPRTLALILYGDLQISLIKELPADRLPIKNCVVGSSYRPKAYEFIKKQVEAGHQAYVICPQVEEGEMDDLENVVEYADKLRAVLPPTIQVAYLHGKMRPGDKNRIMEEFAAGNIHVLVSTTVIEVGINVPNATVMMVENAERFGLAQLHQLRGRVGRGDAQSYCIFINTNEKPESGERLDILNHSNDGFEIAAQDLKLRGPGDLFGIRQSGEFTFRMGDIYGDSQILTMASEAVDRLLAQDPMLNMPEHDQLKEYFEKYDRNTVDFRTI